MHLAFKINTDLFTELHFDFDSFGKETFFINKWPLHLYDLAVLKV